MNPVKKRLKRRFRRKNCVGIVKKSPAVGPSKSRHEIFHESETKEARLEKNEGSVEFKPASTSYDSHLLEKALTQWQFGDWESLSLLDQDQIGTHPDRAKLATLIAAGHLQFGNMETGREYIRLSQSWGCSREWMIQYLISGVYNSLGRLSAVAERHLYAINYFKQSIVTFTACDDFSLVLKARVNSQYEKLNLKNKKEINYYFLDLSKKKKNLHSHIVKQRKKTKAVKIGIVTGIPRSGTSLFSTLINENENCVCLNEIFYNVNTLKRDLYETGNKLLKGEPIRNKFDENGSLTTDTMNSGIVKDYCPFKSEKNITVFSKVNVPYLMQLQYLIRHEIPIFAVVRNPVYCIASWSSSRSAMIPEAKVGPDKDNFHHRWKSVNFSSDSQLSRRAELWNYLAAIIIKHRSSIDIIKYEDIINNSQQVLKKFFNAIGSSYQVGSVEIFDGNINERYGESLDEIEKMVNTYAPNRLIFGYD